MVSGSAEAPEGRRLLVIADLRHASPRWPALLGGLILRGWEVTVVTAPLGPDAANALGFPPVFSERARIIEVGGTSDVLEPIRKVLWLSGLRRKESLTEQVKERLGHQSARGGLDRFFQTAIAILGWPDLQAPWKRYALRAAEAILAGHSFDAIVSSSPYPTSHVVAAAIKRRHPALRWIADFRDLWADNHSYSMPRWRQAIDRVLERRVLRLADAVIAPTEKWAEHLGRIHGKPSICVPNGFLDYDTDTAAPPPSTPPRPFVLLYSGVRYPRKQVIRPILEAIAALRDRGVIHESNFQFRWVGPFDSDTALQVAELGLEPLVLQQPPVARAVAHREQRKAHALLFLQWQDPATDWSSSLKLHEYVGSGRPILATGGHPNSRVSTLLLKTGRSQVAYTAVEAENALRHLVKAAQARDGIEVPRDWFATACALSGISRGLNALEETLQPTHSAP